LECSSPGSAVKNLGRSSHVSTIVAVLPELPQPASKIPVAISEQTNTNL
jgi:hypothetical protein